MIRLNPFLTTLPIDRSACKLCVISFGVSLRSATIFSHILFGVVWYGVFYYVRHNHKSAIGVSGGYFNGFKDLRLGRGDGVLVSVKVFRHLVGIPVAISLEFVGRVTSIISGVCTLMCHSLQSSNWGNKNILENEGSFGYYPNP